MVFLNKHKTVSLVLLLFIFISVYFGLNYSGMCISQMRWLSNEEKIMSVIEEINSRGNIRIEENGKYVDMRKVPYKDTESFLENNPECCKIGPPVSGSSSGMDGAYPDFSFWDQKIWGFGGAQIEGHYYAMYENKLGDKSKDRKWIFKQMTNCRNIF